MPATARILEASTRNRSNWAACWSDDQCDSGACKKNDDGTTDGKVCVATARNDDPPPECSTTPVLFQKQFYRGRAVVLTADVARLKGNPHRFNDKGPSLCVPSGCRVTLCGKQNFGGKCTQPITGPVSLPTLKGLDGQNWNGRVSSVRSSP